MTTNTRRSMVVVSRPNMGLYTQLIDSVNQDIYDNPYFSQTNIPLVKKPDRKSPPIIMCFS